MTGPQAPPDYQFLEVLAAGLQTIRVDSGFTQATLASRAGVGLKTISSFESGERTASISLAQLMAITKACGYTVPTFFSLLQTMTNRLKDGERQLQRVTR